MKKQLKEWQHTAIRNSIDNYRSAIKDYCIEEKPMCETKYGMAYSLISPPLGSAIARRRVRTIIKNTTENSAIIANSSALLQQRTPHIFTVAASYECQCTCLLYTSPSPRDGLL